MNIGQLGVVDQRPVLAFLLKTKACAHRDLVVDEAVIGAHDRAADALHDVPASPVNCALGGLVVLYRIRSCV